MAGEPSGRIRKFATNLRTRPLAAHATDPGRRAQSAQGVDGGALPPVLSGAGVVPVDGVAAAAGSLLGASAPGTAGTSGAAGVAVATRSSGARAPPRPPPSPPP